MLAVVLFLVFSPSTVFSLKAEEIFQIEKRGIDSAGQCGSTGVTVEESGANLKIRSNGLPDHKWGCVNPNPPASSAHEMIVPKDPVLDSRTYCLPMGPIGIAKSGPWFFNPFAQGGNNAVEGSSGELFDCCDGHAQQQGEYHYHKLPTGTAECDNPLYDSDAASKLQILGVAADGWPIYAEWTGLDTADLDECHGIDMAAHAPDYLNTLHSSYAYIAVDAHYPYIMGCYKSTTTRATASVDCSSMTAGQACSCTDGIVTNSAARELVDRRYSKRQELIKRVMAAILGPSKQQRRSRLAYVNKRGMTIESCEMSDCRSDSGSTYDDGVCSGTGPSTGGQPSSPGGQAPPTDGGPAPPTDGGPSPPTDGGPPPGGPPPPPPPPPGGPPPPPPPGGRPPPPSGGKPRPSRRRGPPAGRSVKAKSVDKLLSLLLKELGQ